MLESTNELMVLRIQFHQIHMAAHRYNFTIDNERHLISQGNS
jgi:hypothetical protein